MLRFYDFLLSSPNSISRGSNPPKAPQKGAWIGIFQPNWISHKIAISPTANIGSTPNFHRTTAQHRRLRGWSRMTKLKFKMADSRHIGKCLKSYKSHTSKPIWTKLGWSHPIISPACPPWCGCHGNGCCLETAHWTFSSYGRLEAERVIQFWWNLVPNSKFGIQWKSCDKIYIIFKFKMADGRHVGKYWKCHNSTTNGPIWTKLKWLHPIMSPTCPPWCGYHGNGRCLATAHWAFSS